MGTMKKKIEKKEEQIKLNLKEHIYKGLFIGGLAWLVYAFVMIFRTVYSNKFVQNMNPDVQVPFFSFNYWLVLIIALALFLIVGLLIGFIFYRIRKKINK